MWAQNSIFVCFMLTHVISAIPNTDNLLRNESKQSLNETEQNEIRQSGKHTEYSYEATLSKSETKLLDLVPKESNSFLSRIVDKTDTDKDGFVSLQELKDWIIHAQKLYIMQDSNRQWRNVNPEGKSELSWKDFHEVIFRNLNESFDDSHHYKEMIERDLRRWKKADQNGDGILSKDEFVYFIHPEESLHMKDIVVIETMEDIDKNKDGRISANEYIGDIFNNDIDDLNWVEFEKDHFLQYRDKNNDGYMNFEEVKDWILPDNFDATEAEAKHLIYESDANRDNKLSKGEILSNYALFIGSQFTDFGEALVQQDEF